MTEHDEAFDVDVLEDVALATDFVLTELQKLTATPLFAVERGRNPPAWCAGIYQKSLVGQWGRWWATQGSNL